MSALTDRELTDEQITALKQFLAEQFARDTQAAQRGHGLSVSKPWASYMERWRPSRAWLTADAHRAVLTRLVELDRHPHPAALPGFRVARQTLVDVLRDLSLQYRFLPAYDPAWAPTEEARAEIARYRRYEGDVRAD